MKRLPVIKLAAMLAALAVLLATVPFVALAIPTREFEFPWWFDHIGIDRATIVGYEGSGGDVTIPSTVGGRQVTVLYCAFKNNSDITSLIIPYGVTVVDLWTCYRCTSLASVIIPDSVTEIGSMAFEDCRELTSVIIPDNVTRIGMRAFYGCIGLTSLTIGNSVEDIEMSAFYGCIFLRSVTIPASVTKISADAFSGCASLRKVFFEGNMPEFISSQFHGCAPDLTIYYAKGTTGWPSPTWAGFPCLEYDPNVTCTVTFDLNGGSGMPPAAQNMFKGVKADKPADPARAGYVFDGWYQDEACTDSAWDFNAPVTSDITLYAKWIIPVIMTASPGQVTVSDSFDQIFTLTIENDTVTESVYASDITLGGVFAGLSLGEVTRSGDITVTAAVYGNLADTGTGTITLHENALTDSNSPLQAEVTVTAPGEEAHYTVTYHGNGNTGGTVPTDSNNYAQGAIVTVLANTGGLVKTGYTFAGWNTAADGSGTSYSGGSTFTMGTGNVTLYAKWAYNGGSGDSGDSGGGGGGGGSSTPVTPAYEAAVSGISTAGTTLSVNVNTQAGSATVNLEALAGDIFAGEGTVVITVPSIPGVNTYTLGIPASSLSDSQGQGALTFSTETGSITIPANMLAGIPGTEGSSAGITIGQGDKSGLPAEVQAAIGDRPIVRLTLTLDGAQTEWNNPNTPVTVSIPYTPTAAELANPECIVIWYIDGSGNVVSVPSGRYDPATGTVTFTTTHFSYYAVSYKQVSFKDVAAGAWYARAVSFIAAREITSGTVGGNFSPEAKLTRGQFIVMLMKAYGIAPDENRSDNFADAGDTWYTGYLAAAKRLGISAGVGNNLFAPEKEITRQEMFTLLYNALKVIGKLPQGDSGKSLSSFSDAGDIAPWAEDAMKLLVETGTISGSGNRLSPKDTTTRAQMAQVLYSLLSK